MNIEERLKEVKYLTKNGDLAKKYDFSVGDLNWEEDCEKVKQGTTLLKKLIGINKFREFDMGCDVLLEDIRIYRNLKLNLNTGDYLRHIHTIFLEEKIKTILNNDYSLINIKN